MEQKTESILSNLVLGVLIAFGLFCMGFFISKAVYRAKVSDHYVTVKGLVERQVRANLGVWEIDYREVGNNLINANGQLEHDQQVVVAFLKKNGFSAEEMELRPAKVTDLLANPYGSTTTDTTKQFRYIVIGGVRVRSNNVERIQKVSQTTGDLIKEGIPLSFDTADYASDLSPNPSYFFTQLDTIRPQMLVDATRSARQLADQFAHDSGTKLGGIRRASQGVFQITPRDASNVTPDNSQSNEARSIDKKVRLVTTIDYFLVSGKKKD